MFDVDKVSAVHRKVLRGTPFTWINAPFCYEGSAWVVRLTLDVYCIVSRAFLKYCSRVVATFIIRRYRRSWRFVISGVNTLMSFMYISTDFFPPPPPPSQACVRMSRYREWDLSCKVYVGNLGSSASKHEIESAFSKYGPLRNVWVARNPPGFAFVEFEDPRDAEDAVRGLDGT